MTATARRPLSVAEMLRAIDAAYSGQFTAPMRWQPDGERPGTNSNKAIPTAERTHHHRDSRPVSAVLPGQVTLVVAAHSGAGATTVALLLAEAATADAGSTRLVECANPVRSGIAAATTAELGEDPSGWRRGRRGQLEVDRPAAPAAHIDAVLAPRRSGASPAMTVVDAGWPVWDVLNGANWLTDLIDTAQLVVVCRATVPGVRQTEQLLAQLPGAPVIAAVGGVKWAGAVTASCGPNLRAARASGRIVAVPLERGLDVSGLSAAPLPKQLSAAGRSLLTHVCPDLPALRRAG